MIKQNLLLNLGQVTEKDSVKRVRKEALNVSYKVCIPATW